MQNKFTKLMLAGVFGTTLALPAFGDGHSYGPFPITLKGYSGDKTNSVSYSGQIARHVQHDSLKKLAGSGNLAEMMAYFKGSDKNKKIHAYLKTFKDNCPVKVDVSDCKKIENNI